MRCMRIVLRFPESGESLKLTSRGRSRRLRNRYSTEIGILALQAFVWIEVKVDGVVESLPIPVTAGHSVDPLDLRIHPLTPRVGDVGRRCSDHSIPVVLDQPRHTLDRLQARTYPQSSMAAALIAHARATRSRLSRSEAKPCHRVELIRSGFVSHRYSVFFRRSSPRPTNSRFSARLTSSTARPRCCAIMRRSDHPAICRRVHGRE